MFSSFWTLAALTINYLTPELFNQLVDEVKLYTFSYLKKIQINYLFSNEIQ